MGYGSNWTLIYRRQSQLPFVSLFTFKHPEDNSCPNTTICPLRSQPRTLEDPPAEVIHLLFEVFSFKMSTFSPRMTHTGSVAPKPQGTDWTDSARPSDLCVMSQMCCMCAHTSPKPSAHWCVSPWPSPSAWQVSVIKKNAEMAQSQSMKCSPWCLTAV